MSPPGEKWPSDEKQWAKFVRSAMSPNYQSFPRPCLKVLIPEKRPNKHL